MVDSGTDLSLNTKPTCHIIIIIDDLFFIDTIIRKPSRNNQEALKLRDFPGGSEWPATVRR
jgi:hypothetical protein